MTKDEQREEIARLTQEYLDRGGEIGDTASHVSARLLQVDAQVRLELHAVEPHGRIGSGIWNSGPDGD